MPEQVRPSLDPGTEAATHAQAEQAGAGSDARGAHGQIDEQTRQHQRGEQRHHHANRERDPEPAYGTGRVEEQQDGGEHRGGV